MKVEPTPDGDLNLCLEAPIEWLLLHSSLSDSSGEDFDLAERVGARITDTDEREDWREWVVPELREAFDQQRRVVEDALSVAWKVWLQCPYTLTIRRSDFFAWYALLNQARLALEAKWKFETGGETAVAEEPDAEGEDGGEEEERQDNEFLAARIRSRFYGFLQQHLLDLGLG